MQYSKLVTSDNSICQRHFVRKPKCLFCFPHCFSVAFKSDEQKKGIELSDCNCVVKMLRSVVVSLLQILTVIYPSQTWFFNHYNMSSFLFSSFLFLFLFFFLPFKKLRWIKYKTYPVTLILLTIAQVKISSRFSVLKAQFPQLLSSINQAILETQRS